jgi:hypothetical protein
MAGFTKWILLSVIFILLIFVKTTSYPDTNLITSQKAGICILEHSTEFKDILAFVLVKEFNARGMSAAVDELSNKAQYNPADYGAVVLLSEVQIMNPLQDVIWYYTNNHYPGNIVYFATYSLMPFPYGYELDKKKVDAITSASDVLSQNILDEAKSNIVTKTMAILNIGKTNSFEKYK